MPLCGACAESLYDHPEVLEWDLTEYRLLHISWETCGNCGQRFRWGDIQFYHVDRYGPIYDRAGPNRRMIKYRIGSWIYGWVEKGKLWWRRRRPDWLN